MAHSIEVVANSTRSEKPGWAYVPDTGYDHTKAPLQLGSRKRNTRQVDASDPGISTRQKAASQRRIADLEKDVSRDLSIPLPNRQRPKASTIATRKIIESQRSFAHFLADEEAVAQSELDTGQNRSRMPRLRQAIFNKSLEGRDGRVSHSTGRSLDSPRGASKPGLESRGVSIQTGEAKLMHVTAPAAPSAAVLDALVSMPATQWNEARAQSPSINEPARPFCELCGYWGRVKCLSCGARLCGLACKGVHDGDRCQKYGV